VSAVGAETVRKHGKPIEVPIWDLDYQGVAFHAFRHACGSLLFAHGKTLKQVQEWLRHSQLTTTMNGRSLVRVQAGPWRNQAFQSRFHRDQNPRDRQWATKWAT